ncbi:MAG: RNA polymerase sigma factor [Thermoleophilia bacterium]
MNARSDSELVAAAQGGSTDAVGALFERHWPDAWRVALLMTGSADRADDVAQQAFVRAVARIGGLRDGGSFRAWLHRIVVNEARDAMRRGRREVLMEETPDLPVEDSYGLPGPGLQAVAGLPEERRVAVLLRYCVGCSVEEAAEILGLPVGTVQSRAARGLAQLRAELEVTDGP